MLYQHTTSVKQHSSVIRTDSVLRRTWRYTAATLGLSAGLRCHSVRWPTGCEGVCLLETRRLLMELQCNIIGKTHTQVHSHYRPLIKRPFIPQHVQCKSGQALHSPQSLQEYLWIYSVVRFITGRIHFPTAGHTPNWPHNISATNHLQPATHKYHSSHKWIPYQPHATMPCWAAQTPSSYKLGKSVHHCHLKTGLQWAEQLVDKQSVIVPTCWMPLPGSMFTRAKYRNSYKTHHPNIGMVQRLHSFFTYTGLG